MDKKKEKIVNIIFHLKTFWYGFEAMTNIAQEVEQGSPALAFYFNGIYHYIAAMFLLDKGQKQMGGMLYEALKEMELEHRIQSIEKTFSETLGETNFGEIIRKFRNKYLVHGNYQQTDLDGIYSDVDLREPETLARFNELLERLYYQTRELALDLCKDVEIPFEDVGIYPTERE